MPLFWPQKVEARKEDSRTSRSEQGQAIRENDNQTTSDTKTLRQ